MSTLTNPARAREKRQGTFPRAKKLLRANRQEDNKAQRGVFGPALTDLLLIGASGLAAYWLLFSSRLFVLDEDVARRIVQLPHGAAGAYAGFLLVYAALLGLVAHTAGLYRTEPGRSSFREGLLAGRAVAITAAILIASVYVSGIREINGRIVAVTAACSVASLGGWRLWRGSLMRRRREKGIGLRHAIIIGAGKAGRLLAGYLEANPALGYEVRGFLDAGRWKDPRILGTPNDLARVARQQFADDVFITLPSDRELVKQTGLAAMQLNLNVQVVPELYDGLAWRCPLQYVGEIPVRVLHQEPIPAFGLFLKRATDVIASAMILLVLSPLLALIVGAVVADSPGPVFYRAYRMGKKGRKFVCYKFRTMVANADEMKEELRTRNERDGPFFKITNDPRLTRIGGFLRRYSLDELPQLWNVLKGEMSLVGPRPHPLDDVKQYRLEHLRRLDVTPGITCLWQTQAREDPSFETVMQLDSQYIENWSYLLDLKILLRTIPAVLSGNGR